MDARRTGVVGELVGLLRQQEAREHFETGRLVEFGLKLEQRLDLILTQPHSLQRARAERQRQVRQPTHHTRALSLQSHAGRDTQP